MNFLISSGNIQSFLSHELEICRMRLVCFSWYESIRDYDNAVLPGLKRKTFGCKRTFFKREHATEWSFRRNNPSLDFRKHYIEAIPHINVSPKQLEYYNFSRCQFCKRKEIKFRSYDLKQSLLPRLFYKMHAFSHTPCLISYILNLSMGENSLEKVFLFRYICLDFVRYEELDKNTSYTDIKRFIKIVHDHWPDLETCNQKLNIYKKIEIKNDRLKEIFRF